MVGRRVLQDGGSSRWEHQRAQSAWTNRWKPPLLPQQRRIKLWAAGLGATDDERSGRRSPPAASAAALLRPAGLLCPCTTSAAFPPLPVAHALLLQSLWWLPR